MNIRYPIYEGVYRILTIIGWCELLKNTYKAVFKLIEKQ